MNKLLVRSRCVSLLLLAAAPTPPVVKKVSKVTEVNGQKLVDNYFWLRDKSNPEVKAYLDAENAYV
jgi:oligopeptidase B